MLRAETLGQGSYRVFKQQVGFMVTIVGVLLWSRLKMQEQAQPG